MSQQLRILTAFSEILTSTWWLIAVFNSIPGDPIPYSGLFQYQAHTWYTYIQAKYSYT